MGCQNEEQKTREKGVWSPSQGANAKTRLAARFRRPGVQKEPRDFGHQLTLSSSLEGVVEGGGAREPREASKNTKSFPLTPSFTQESKSQVRFCPRPIFHLAIVGAENAELLVAAMASIFRNPPPILDHDRQNHPQHQKRVSRAHPPRLRAFVFRAAQASPDEVPGDILTW